MSKVQLKESITKQVQGKDIEMVRKSVRELYRIYLKNKTKMWLVNKLLDEWDEQSKVSEMDDFIDQATEIQFDMMFGSLPVKSE